MTNLHDADDRAAIIRKILNGGDDVSSVEERLSVSGDEHEQANQRNSRPVNNSGDGQPHKKIAGEALYRPCHVYNPRSTERGMVVVPAAAMDGDGGVEEAGENAGVGADVFEDGNRIEC